jgi:molecular chaperone Hsp33
LLSTGIENLEEMANSNEDTQVECHFCDKKYSFKPTEIRALINSAK